MNVYILAGLNSTGAKVNVFLPSLVISLEATFFLSAIRGGTCYDNSYFGVKVL